MRYFSLQPLVAGDNRDAEDVGLWGLDQDEHRLLVGASWAGGVLVDDDFAFGSVGCLTQTREECDSCGQQNYSAGFHRSLHNLEDREVYQVLVQKLRIACR